MTRLADKEQSLLGPIRFGRVPAVRARLAGVVGIDLDTERASQHGFVVQEGMQFGKRPLGGVSVRPALLLRRFLPFFAFGPLADVGQVLQANERMGMGVQDTLADAVIFIQLQPSLSLADSDASPRGAASAFALKSLLESGVMVGLVAYGLAAVKLRAAVSPLFAGIVQGGNGGKIALPDIHPNNARVAFRRGSRD